ncbi:hypothetical protein DL96DRAFT_1585365 [Flagelloscypha sp. PMI_526]|nr:hypothetical protein DL96DRAFT_1585365 [Flagelloscypha sp. PMI_526]
MPATMKLHSIPLRHFIRICGGFEVKTNAACAFNVRLPEYQLCPLVVALCVNSSLLEGPEPLETLESEDGKAVYGPGGMVITRGLTCANGHSL